MKKLKIIIPVLLLTLMVLLTGYRYFYGEWNPFVSPDRVECYSRRYYKSGNPKELTEKERPSCSINSLNILTGKRLYSSEPKGEFVPTVIYLKVGDGKYQTYALSGGP